MLDVQNLKDMRGIPLQHVGVRSVRYPIQVLDKKNKTQHTIGSFNLYVDLTAEFKGTHMSRFIEVLNQYRKEIDIQKFDEILESMQKKLNAAVSVMEVSFPYFIEKEAPVSKTKSLMEYASKFWGSSKKVIPSVAGIHPQDKHDFYVQVKVPVTTLCPCSKEISERGAHNQRSVVQLSVRTQKFVWIEDLIRLVEDSASSELYPLLKRVDEKYVTERAYDRPRFAEDIVREVALRLDDWSAITWYAIECETFESIHGHNAYAFVKKDKICHPSLCEGSL